VLVPRRSPSATLRAARHKMGSMRMQQSLAQIEEAFVEEIEEDRERRERLARRAEMRSRQRHIEKSHKHGSVRFALLVLTLIATAVVVTIAMFQTLYYVMG
jgi:membrane glycosyltransferase